MNELQKTSSMSFSAPKTFTEAIELAKVFASSRAVPKHYENNPGAIVVAWDYGLNLGLGLSQSLSSIFVVNGIPNIWGDTALGIVRASGLLEFIDESVPGQCTVKRKGEEAIISKFSMEDAKKAGLTTKAIWLQYPDRMLKMRNRAFALRDAFTDLIKGLSIKEEVDDYNSPFPDAVDVTANTTPIKNVLAESTKLAEPVKPIEAVKPVETVTDQETGEVTEAVTLNTNEMNEALALMDEITKLRKEKDAILAEQSAKSPVALGVLERMDTVIASGLNGLSLEQLKKQRDFLLNLN